MKQRCINLSGGARVLVADDNQGVRSSTAAILRGAGYEVLEAEDGEAALTSLSSNPVDVLVLDVRMPKRDGISVLESIDPPPPPPAVLLVSAFDLDGDVRVRLGERVSKHMRKPVPPASLLRAVSEAAGSV